MLFLNLTVIRRACCRIAKLKDFPQHDQDRVISEAFRVHLLLFSHLFNVKKVFRGILGFLWLSDSALDNKKNIYVSRLSDFAKHNLNKYSGKHRQMHCCVYGSQIYF